MVYAAEFNDMQLQIQNVFAIDDTWSYIECSDQCSSLQYLLGTSRWTLGECSVNLREG
jgi:hypothetical protein